MNRMRLISILALLFLAVSTIHAQGDWEQRGLVGVQINDLIWHPNNDSTIISVGSQGIYLSYDQGWNWSTVPLDNVLSIAVSHADPQLIFVGADDQIIRSLDGGSNWETVGSIPGSEIHALAINPTQPTIVYARTEFGIQRSLDAGETWASVWEDVSAVRANYDVILTTPLHPYEVWAINHSSVLFSDDAGDTWTVDNSAFEGSPTLVDLSLDPDGNLLFVASQDDVQWWSRGASQWQDPVGVYTDDQPIVWMMACSDQAVLALDSDDYELLWGIASMVFDWGPDWFVEPPDTIDVNVMVENGYFGMGDRRDVALASENNGVWVNEEAFWTSVEEYAQRDHPYPESFSLHSVYPNPFNSTATVTIGLPIPSRLTVDVLNVNGQIVSTVHDGYTLAGRHELSWSAHNLASGVYFVRAMVPGNEVQMQKVMLMQ
jgi:photosystem II stability/assembly factor-like uncharacterized protein